MAARALSHRLPIDIAEYITNIAACTQIQAVTRGMLARQPREPSGGAGFERVDAWVYRYTGTGESFATDLESWCHTHYRPGAYTLHVNTTHADGTKTTFGDERALITPTTLHWTHDLLANATMYFRAFSTFHGPCETLVRVRRMRPRSTQPPRSKRAPPC